MLGHRFHLAAYPFHFRLSESYCTHTRHDLATFSITFLNVHTLYTTLTLQDCSVLPCIEQDMT